ncbi:MAG TPA: GGDEF domain-containing protein [Terracidiphilus sp.]|jgi:diguanylate cyclase (GGDEF)-like protein
MDISVIVSMLLILVVQRAGFEILGTSPAGSLFQNALTLLANSLAIVSCVVAASRGRGATRIFWVLFATVSTLELVGDAGWAYYRYFHIAVPGSALFPSLLYRLEAAPIAIALFLSDDSRTSKLESFLDSCMVVGLVGVTTYQLQIAELDAHNTRIWQLITYGTTINAIMVLAALIRFRYAATASLRGLFARVAIYLSIYLAIAFVTSYVDAYLPNVDASVDLIWILLSLTTAGLAATWRPPAADERPQRRRIGRRTALLCFNLTLATMVLGSAVLGLRLVSSARVIGLIAVSIVLFSFAVRSAIMQDIQEKSLYALQESRKELERQALYDELTGLPNRRLFAERLSQVLAIAEREGHTVALLYVDLDGFKPVNDGLGHSVGDLVLKGVAQRMLARVRKSDTLARMGGDEFTWLVAHLSNYDHAAQLAEEMLRALSEPFTIDGHSIAITASIGIGLYPECASDAASLIEQADSAMYEVKHHGKNGVKCFATGIGLVERATDSPAR